MIFGGNSGVTVKAGSLTRAGVKGGSPDGVKGGTLGGKGDKLGGTGQTPGGTGKGPAFAPKGDLYIAQYPKVSKKVQLECPAARDEGIYGTVLLRVEVRKDGRVRNVKVLKGIGHGCDKIAKKALKKTRFKPAVTTDGKVADFVIRGYEYEYRAAR